MKKFLLLAMMVSCGIAFGQPSVGDIAFIGFNADGDKALSIVALSNIDGSGTPLEIYFTDDNWSGSAFAGSEGIMTWTISSLITTGTVIDFTDISGTETVSVGSVSVSGSLNPSVSGDAIYCYIGSSGTPTTFLAAITNDDFTTEGSGLTGTGLTVGTNAIELDEIDTDADIAEYTGNRVGTKSELLAAINNANNWISQDASLDQSNDGVAPDLPFKNSSFIVSSENTITWDGSESSSWTNGDNWGGGVAPTSSDNVVIANAGTAAVIAAGVEASCFNLTIDASASLTISSGGSLAIFGTATNNGNYTIEKGVTGSAGYSILGAPITNATINAMSLADYIYGYDNSDDSWPIPNGTDAMNEGVGYFVGYDESSPSVSFTGTPVTGDVTYTVSETSGFELVANPYAAAIVVSDFLADNTIITGGVYLWDDGGANTGGERVGDYIAVTGVGAASAVDPTGQTNGFTGDDSPADDGYIASVQGFFVEINNSGTLTFSADQQTSADESNDESDHYRSTDFQKVKIAIAGENLYNEVLVGLGEGATFGVDRTLDAKKFNSGSPLSFYSMLEDDKYVIQALPNVGLETISVPLGFDTKAGQLTLSVVDFKNIPDHMTVTLVDHLTGTMYDLKETEFFTFASEEVVNDQRFELQFSPMEVLSVEEPSKGISVFGNTSQMRINSELEGLQQVVIYSLDGKIAFNESINFSNRSVAINTNLIRNQAYVLRVGEESLKFIIK